MANHPPLVHAWADALEDAPSGVIETVARRLQRRLSTLVLETLDEAALRHLLADLRQDTEQAAT